ncbi:MAG: HtaA domain-containing protein [Actinomycetes bacterium]
MSSRLLTAPRRLAAAFGAALITLSAGIVPAAAADSTPASGLVWGVKQSFRDYVVGPIARGEISVSAPAVAVEGGFGFAAAGGDDAAAEFSGAVTFTGHEGVLDLTFADPVVRIDGEATATLTVVVNGVATDVATLDLAGAAYSEADGAATYAGAPVSLTQAGSDALEGFYPAGTAMDPATFTIALAEDGGAEPEPSPDPSGSPSPAPTPTPTPGVTGELKWGVKESFVSYVEGPIAHGAIEVAGGATREGDTFTFAATASALGEDLTGTANYGGAVRFTGHAGELDATFDAPRVEVVDGSTGYLSVEVDGERLVMARLDLAAAARTQNAATVTWAGVPATLTVDGTAVFAYQGSGFYEAGTVLAPVTFTAAVVDGDGGSGGDGGGDDGGGDGGSGGDGGGTGGGTPSQPAPKPTPSAPADDATDLAVGRLEWGVKQAFRSYVTGPIARGSITVSSGAAYSDGRFVFLQDGGNANPVSGTGTARYDGAVRFAGHGGILDVTMANPRVTLEGAGRASLVMTVNGTSTAIATVDVAAGTRSTRGGAVTISGAPATLTSAGARVFSYNGSGFYPAGTVMDTVTVTFGATATAAERPTASAQVAAAGSASATASEDAAPGAGEFEELAVDAATLERLQRGGLVTLDVEGFEPGEQVSVVLYSDPVVLATLEADASGAVSWTGAIPASYSGAHDLVFVGASSGARYGIALDIPERAAQPGMCLASGGEIKWAFKDSFLAYIDSSIANGTWEVAGGVEDLGYTFVWPVTGGAVDPELAVGTVTAGGSVRFTGHGGVLDTTLANPTLEFSADGAYVLADLVTTTQEGAEVSVTQVRLGELDLAAGSVTGEGSTVTLEEVPVVLTAAGSAAFGTYGEGEELAPLSATVSSDDGCILALAGQDVAPAPEASPSAEPLATSDTVIDAAAEPTATTPAALWWAVAAAAVLAAAGGGYVVGRRRA